MRKTKPERSVDPPKISSAHGKVTVGYGKEYFLSFF